MRFYSNPSSVLLLLALATAAAAAASNDIPFTESASAAKIQHKRRQLLLRLQHTSADNVAVEEDAILHQHHHHQWERRHSRFLEEEGEDEDDEEEDQQDGGDNNNDFNYDRGYITATQCRSFKVEEPDGENLDDIFEWNAANGNGLELFRVAQESFVYYNYNDDTYTDDSGNNNNNNNNNDDDDDDDDKSASYMIDLNSWTTTVATIGLGKDTAPSCEQIYNVQDIFQTNSNENDDITKFYAIASSGNNDNNDDNDNDNNGDDDVDFGDWEPQLFVGPICGMGDGTVNIGVFLDDTCTTYVPQWTYRYRKALARGIVSYDETSTTLLKIDAYTSSKNNAFHHQHRWSCENGDDFCSTLLSYSADTLECKSSDNNEDDNEDDNEDEDGDRRLEEGEEEEEDDNNNDEDNDSYTNYQISQEELESIDTTCAAVLVSYIYGEGTLEDYLKENGQLKRTMDYNKQKKIIIQIMLLTILLFAVVVVTTMFVRRRSTCSQSRSKSNTEENKNFFVKTSRKTKAKSNNKSSTKKKISSARTGDNNNDNDNDNNNKNNGGANTNKKRGGWFSRFRRNKNRIGEENKQQTLLE